MIDSGTVAVFIFFKTGVHSGRRVRIIYHSVFITAVREGASNPNCADGIQAVGILIFAFALSMWQLMLFALVFGPASAAALSLRPAVQGDFFGRKAFGAIQGLIMGLMTIGTIVSPIITGWFFDRQQNYQFAFILMAAVGFLALPAILVARAPAKAGGRSSQGRTMPQSST